MPIVLHYWENQYFETQQYTIQGCNIVGNEVVFLVSPSGPNVTISQRRRARALM